MPTYRLYVTWEVEGDMIIEADSEEEAIQKAENSELPNRGSAVFGTLDVINIEPEEDIEKFRL